MKFQYLALALPALVAAKCRKYPGNPSCVNGTYNNDGYYFVTNCAAKLVVPSNATVHDTYAAVTWIDCLNTCGEDDPGDPPYADNCCAVNYAICGGVCTLYTGPGGYCGNVPFGQKKSKLFQSSYIFDGGD